MAGRPVGSAVGTDDDPVAWNLESAGHLLAGVRRRHDDAVRPVGVRTRQHRIVPSDFPCATFGMAEKVNVVDGDQARGAPGRDQQWRRRVHDIERAGGQGFDGRPLAVMPEPVQHPDGHTTVDPDDTCRERRDQAVFPGTAEDRDLRVGSPALGERLDQSGHPEPYPRSMAQRGAVVDENPHDSGGDSFRQGGLWCPAPAPRRGGALRMTPASGPSLIGLRSGGAGTTSGIVTHG